MKGNSIASENVPHFFVKLKKRRMEKWYIHEIQFNKQRRQYFTHADHRKNFEIDQIGFYKKYFWYHFISDTESGWIPHKFIRKNYRALSLPLLSRWSSNMSSEEIVLATLIQFARPNISRDKLLSEFEMASNLNIRLLLLKNIGSYKNLTKKSYRRIKSQINRNRPVILLGHQDGYCLILFGFSRRTFFYFDPLDGNKKSMTIKQLNHFWKVSGYSAISY